MLRFIAISGTTSVNENLYVYEYINRGNTEMIVVDCGVGFPDLEMRGVDLVIPDFTYVLQNKDKLKAIFVSQAHEDHQGALPFLLKDIKPPVYAPKLVAAIIEDKLRDYGVKGATINIYDPHKDVINIGSFKITPFMVSHSVPDTVGFSIDTPEGQVIHIAEHKFDPAPVVGEPFDEEKAKNLAKKGVLFLASDCLGSNKKGTTPPEKGIEANIEAIVRGAKSAVFFSCISSNLSRIQQAINVAGRTGRKVVLAGRSIQKKTEIANELGYVKLPDGLIVEPRQATKLSGKNIMYIIAGSFAQVGSSLYRVSTNDHKFIKAQKGDTAILSSNPAPPYTKEAIDLVVDNLIDLGLDVHYYDLDEGLHVSGHGRQDDIVKLFNMVKPKYYVPVGGTIRYMDAYRKLAMKNGASEDSIFELKSGESLEFDRGSVRRGKTVDVKEVLVDGLGVGDVGRVVLSDRKTLAKDGVVIALIQLSIGNKIVTDPELISRGFVFQKKEKDFLKESARVLRKKLESTKKLSSRTARFTTIDFLTKHFSQETGRRPMILPVIVEA